MQWVKFWIGFANFGSMGIALAAMGVFAPTRKRTLIKIAPRALIAANMVYIWKIKSSFYIVYLGLLYDAHDVSIPIYNPNSTLV